MSDLSPVCVGNLFVVLICLSSYIHIHCLTNMVIIVIICTQYCHHHHTIITIIFIIIIINKRFLPLAVRVSNIIMAFYFRRYWPTKSNIPTQWWQGHTWSIWKEWLWNQPWVPLTRRPAQCTTKSVSELKVCFFFCQALWFKSTIFVRFI